MNNKMNKLMAQMLLIKIGLILIIAFAVLISSCSINITPQQAANGKARCGMGLR
jgi:hypothetical protein